MKFGGGRKMKQTFKTAAVLVAMTATMFAANPKGATNTNTVTGSVALQATVQTSVRISFSAGTTTVNGGAACVLGGSVVVGSASDVSFNLGNIDGLGLATPTCGGLVNAGGVAVGGTSATWATSYKYTPEWSGFGAAVQGVTALTTPGFTNSGTLTAVEGNAATTAALTNVPLGAGHSFTATAAQSGVTVERFMGVTVLNNNGGANTRFAGADAALITFTLTAS
jgi:hypothetical protein